jgi:hypothetical protein
MHSFFDLSKGAKILLAIVSLVVLAEGAYLYYIQTKPVISACQYMISEWEKAMPDAAKAKEPHTGPIAAVNYESEKWPMAVQSKQVIDEAVAKGPNFAGHFVMADWDCGENCKRHAIVDAITGNIMAYGIPSETGLRYTAESSIFVTNPVGNVPSLADVASMDFELKRLWFNTPREYYVLEEEGTKVAIRRLCIENTYDSEFN